MLRLLITVHLRGSEMAALTIILERVHGGDKPVGAPWYVSTKQKRQFPCSGLGRLRDEFLLSQYWIATTVQCIGHPRRPLL